MSKLDMRLQRQLHLWNQNRDVPVEIPHEGGRPKVLVRFSGDVSDLERVGMRVEMVIGDIALGHVDLADVARLAEVSHVSAVEAAAQGRPLIHDSVRHIHADVESIKPLGLTGKDVIVGIVDTGIDIFHGAFRTQDHKTRIHSLWDQTIKVGDLPPRDPPYKPPDGFATGIEFDMEGINNALNTGTFPSSDADGHGSHVAGIAAGNGLQSGGCHEQNYYVGVAPEADFVIVKSPLDSNAVIQGIQYIFSVAAKEGKPAVVNISIGFEHPSSPRDGTGSIDSVFDRLIVPPGNPPVPGRAIVVGAGNDGGDSDVDVRGNGIEEGFHAFCKIAANGSAILHFDMPGNVEHKIYFEAWYRGATGSAARLDLTLTAPSGRRYGPVTFGSGYSELVPFPAGGDFVEAGSQLASAVYNGINVDIGQNKNNDKSPVDPRDLDKIIGTVTSGEWTIKLEEKAGAVTDVDIWISSTHAEPLPQFPAFVKNDRDRKRTITVPATANNVICVGAYDDRVHKGAVADFSSRGPRIDEDPAHPKPDLCAPGVGIVSTKSGTRPVWYCCDCCLDFYIAKDGTSQAAPHVTGVVALIFQRNKNLTYDQVRQYLRDTCDRPTDPDTGIPITPPDPAWGYGIVNAVKACASVPAATAMSITSISAADSGGNGASERILFPASPAAYSALASRLRLLERRFGGYQAWHDLSALVSTHVDEVLRLINTNRRVATTWHRLGGPHLVGWLLASATWESPVLPRQFAGREFSPALGRWLDMLVRYGSPRLREDVSRYGPWLLSLPGTLWPSASRLAG